MRDAQKNKETCAARRERERNKIIDLLGGKCQYKGCNWTDRRALQVDHKHGGGSKEIRGLSPDARNRLIHANPDKYQLLCANHNWIKRAEMKEFLSNQGGRKLNTETRAKISKSLEGKTQSEATILKRAANIKAMYAAKKAGV